MNKFLRKLSLGVSRATGAWLTLLLLLAVLVPSVCLFWFMNQAMHNERLAARQKVADLYRSQLGPTQARLEQQWHDAAARVEMQLAGTPAPALFDRIVRAGIADAIVCFDETGRVLYPSQAQVVPAEPEEAAVAWTDAEHMERTNLGAAARAYAGLAVRATNAVAAGRALQAQARCLLQAGDKAAAIAVLTGLTGGLAQERFQQVADPEGRRIVPNARLLAIELLRDSDPAEARALAGDLQQQLLDYGEPAMPSSQRRFLMRELQRLFPHELAFPTAEAEELAARYLQAGPPVRPGTNLAPSGIPDVWHCAAGQRLVLLHEAAPLLDRLRAMAAADLPPDMLLACVAPGDELENPLASVPAGSSFPGWHLAVVPRDPALFDTQARQRIASYTWIGVLSIGTVAVLVLLALGLVRRQTALTRLRNDLVANVSHELKTPLASMRLLVETLLNSPRLDEQTTREYLDLIARENVRLSRLIENFLTFSRIERNKSAFQFKPVPAAAILAAAAGAVRERFSGPNCRFEVLAPADLPWVLADADAMVAALINLLDNAHKYSGESKAITLSAAAGNGTVSFAVRDNGIGLSPRETRRIFKRFYRVNQPAPGAAAGCGLGLSIVDFIVSAHGGTVRVESEPNRGSTFTITLPRTTAAAQSAAAEA